MSEVDLCVACGDYVPEGRQICPKCEKLTHEGEEPKTKRLHPKWGYDLDQVKYVYCLHCHLPIGDEPYVEYTALARFGQMLFYHTRCLKELEEKGDAQVG